MGEREKSDIDLDKLRRRAPSRASVVSPWMTMADAHAQRASILHRTAASKWWGAREYLLLIIEASLALAAYVIQRRIFSINTRLNTTTSRQLNIDLLYYEGFSSIGSLLVGCMAGLWLHYYTVAVLSASIHFGSNIVILIEHIVREEINQDDNPYDDLIFNICIVSNVLIKSSDFTRLVYGLQGMRDREKSAAYLFIFFQFWFSGSATKGGLIVNVFYGAFKYFGIDAIIISFVTCGSSLFLLWTFFGHEETEEEEKEMMRDVISCLSLAVYYKIFRVKKRGAPSDFLEKTKGRCSFRSIANTKLFVKFVAAIWISNFGITFVVTHPAELFYDFDKIKSSTITDAVGIRQLTRTVFCMSMLFSYFVFWPLVRLVIRIPKKSMVPKFLMGYAIAALYLFYGGIITRYHINFLEYGSDIAYLRIVNTRADTVTFTHFKSSDIAISSFEVPPLAGITISYKTKDLFPATVEFKGSRITNFTIFMSATLGEVDGYIILDPPLLVKMRGHIPMYEGPPGTNIGAHPRIYFYNTAKTLDGATVLIKRSYEHKILKEVELKPGIMSTVAIAPGTYDFSIPIAGLRKTETVEEGGLYGLLTYSAKTTRRMTMDCLVVQNEASVWVFQSQIVLYGLAVGLSYPALKSGMYTNTPIGLLGMIFACLSSLEGVSSWIVWIGFLTWHRFITYKAMYIYAAAVTAECIVCSFFYFKEYKKGSKNRLPID